MVEDILAVCEGHASLHYDTVLPDLFRQERHIGRSRGGKLSAPRWRDMYALSAPAENGDTAKKKNPKSLVNDFNLLWPLEKAFVAEICKPRLRTAA